MKFEKLAEKMRKQQEALDKKKQRLQDKITVEEMNASMAVSYEPQKRTEALQLDDI